MVFGGLNVLAVLLAALAAFAFGAVYYGLLSKPWMAAARIDPNVPGKPLAPLLVNSILWEVVMAFVLAGLIGHLGPDQTHLRNGIISGGFVWIGFVLPSLAINQRYQGFGWRLTLIDGAHWLGVLLIMGAVIGWMGT